MGASRFVAVFIISFLFLLIVTPIFHYFTVHLVSKYVIQSVAGEDKLAEAWNTSIQVCESLKPQNATWSCEERINEIYNTYGVDLRQSAYSPSNQKFFPFSNEWWNKVFNGAYVMLVVLLSLMFAFVEEVSAP